MSISKFFKEAIAYRILGGHAADHVVLNTPSWIDSSASGFTAPNGNLVGMRKAIKQTAVPVVIPSSGTIVSGVVTITTPLSAAYHFPFGAWVYYPAGATLISGAGYYWTVFNSTTAGQVYTAYQAQPITTVPFNPYIPTNLVAITGGSAYTQTTANLAMANVIVPGNSIGVNGLLEVSNLFGFSGTNGNKTTQVLFGTSTMQLKNNTWGSTVAGNSEQSFVRNRGVSNSQICFTNGYQISFGGTAASNNVGNNDTTVQQPVMFYGQLTSASDNIILEGYSVVVNPS